MTSLAEALGWALLHFLWQGAVLGVALGVALCFRRSARVRYLLACGAMAAMVLAFLFTMAICWPSGLPRARIAEGAAAALHLPQGPDAATRSALDGLRDSAPPAWFVPVWLGGVSLFYLYSLVAWLAATRLKTRGAFAAPVEWREKLDRLSAALGLRRRVALLESCLAEVPVAIGYLRPVILLPLGMLAGLTAEQVEAVLIHELAHIRRFDYLVNVAQTLVEGLLFYHPAVWWTSITMRREREHCCDDVVVALQGDARGYAATLARLELTRGVGREPALAATGGNLMKRIHRLLQQPEGPRVAAPLISAVMLLAAASLAFAAWQTQTQTPPPAQTQHHLVEQAPHGMVEQLPKEAPAAAAETPYKKWLNQDVAYIITDAERAAFKGLQTDAEREHFIEQFWLVRDPTPGTVENEFKQEHYRRIAYANTRFSTKDELPGWKTDRGRIYITYGPPDEIEDHPSTPAKDASQAWRYRFIEGVGNNVIIEFLDPNKTNEYRMTMDPSQKDKHGVLYVPGAALTVAEQLGPEPKNLTVAVQIKRGPAPSPGFPVAPGRVVSFPVATHGHPVDVSAEITGPDGSVAAEGQDKLNGPEPRYVFRFTLVPGSYQANVNVKDRVSGETVNRKLKLEVK